MSAKIITVFNQKGGCGKTTVCMQLAGAFAHTGYKTLVIDMDPQGTAMRWASAAPEEDQFAAALMSLHAMGGKMHREVKNHIDTYDVILVDCPPAMDSAAPTSAMLVSDLALIPVVPAPADIWAAQSAVQLAASASQINEALKTYVVLNMVQQQTSLARDMIEALRAMENISVLKSTLGLRTTFRDCQLYGSSVHKVSRTSTAFNEVEALKKEISVLLGLPPKKRQNKSS